MNLLACATLTPAILFSRPADRVPAKDSSEGAAPIAVAAGRLAPGPPESREIRPGESHLYEIGLEAGQFARVLLGHAGVNLSGTLCADAGRGCFEYRGLRRGPTPLSFVARESGTYRLEVRSPKGEEDAGRYEVSVEVVRPAAASDESLIAAERLFAEGERLRAEWAAESSRAAVEKYIAAREQWRKAGERGGEASALLGAAEALHSLNESRRALALFESALSLSRAARDGRGEADALNGAGSALLTLGETRKANRYLLRALEVSRRSRHRHGEAQSLNNVGEARYTLGDVPASLDHCLQALALWHDISDRQGQALALLNAGHAHSILSNVQSATDSLERSLRLWRGAGNAWGEAHALTALGHLKSKLGEKQEALNLYRRAAPLFRKMGDRVGAAFVLNGMGYVYDELGEKGIALEYHEEALGLFRSADYGDEAGTLLRLGEVHYSNKNYPKALEFFRRALASYSALDLRVYESYTLRDIGMVYEALGDGRKALAHYRRALALNRVGGDRRWQAHTLNNIAHVHETAGDRRQALSHYERALSLNRATGDRFGEAATLYNIARLTRDGGRLDEASRLAEEVLRVAESLRTGVASQTLRASYFATAQQYYELAVDVRMRLHERRPGEGHDAAAFELSERARARSLVETVREVQSDIRQGADPALLEREHALRRELSAKAERRTRLPAAGAEAQALAAEIARLTVEHDEVKAQIKSSSPAYASLTRPRPLGLRDVQQQVLDDDVLLLEYFLGDEKSYLWAVTKNEITTHTLPGRAEVERAARGLYESLVARQNAAPAAGPNADDEQYWRQARALSRMVLGPAAGRLAARRLLVVPDGALQYVPFQALPHPASLGESGEQAPLMLTHEVVNQPSASSLAALRGDGRRRQRAGKAVAVFADPVFEKDDSRVRRGAGPEMAAALPAAAELARSLRDVDPNGGGITRLLASREEADAIERAARGGEVSKAVGFDASREAVLKADLGQYRVVHFATHGLLDDRHPELSGVVLSLYDERGKPQDGFLRLHDIYNMSLPVEVVVLSACNTGLGKDVRGEGLIGLTRGFMYAGAASVVASLWKVDDEATAEMMGHFYKAMLTDGLPPSAALREAQIAVWKQRRWRSPYYWAAFTLQGEYRPSPRRGPAEIARGATVGTRKAIFVAVTASALLLAAVPFIRRRRVLAVLRQRKSRGLATGELVFDPPAEI